MHFYSWINFIALREPVVLKNAYVGRLCDTTKTPEIRKSIGNPNRNFGRYHPDARKNVQ